MDSTLPELLRLPEVPIIVFERPPLIQALCQVRFTRVLGVADRKFVAPFQRAIQDLYPIANPTGQVELRLHLGDSDAEIRQGSMWHFSDQADNWKVVLAEDFLAIETHRYENFVDFLHRLRSVLEALKEHVSPQLITRIGLRYVNEIRPGHHNWPAVVRRNLLGPLEVPEFKDNVLQSIQAVALRYPEDHGINVRHGLLPRGTTVRGGADEEPRDEPFYLLDIDAYREFPLPGGLRMNVNTICEQVESYNKAIYRLFRWAVTEDYISTLGVRHHDDN